MPDLIRSICPAEHRIIYHGRPIYVDEIEFNFVPQILDWQCVGLQGIAHKSELPIDVGIADDAHRGLQRSQRQQYGDAHNQRIG